MKNKAKDKNYHLMMITIIIMLFLSAIAIIKIVYIKANASDNNNENPNIDEKMVAKVGAKYFESIQEAIASTKEGDVIYLVKDVDENIIITNKNLTIDGSGYKIRYPEGLNFVPSTVSSIIGIVDSKVTIRNLKIDGESDIDNKSFNVGIYASNSSVAIEDVEIYNINHRDNKLDSYPYGIGIHIYFDTSNHNVLIRNTKVENFHQTGIYINNRANSIIDISIRDCYITGIGNTDIIEQRGIALHGDLKGNIQDNQIKDLKNSKDFEFGYGILANTNLEEVDLKNNIFSNVEVENEYNSN